MGKQVEMDSEIYEKIRIFVALNKDKFKTIKGFINLAAVEKFRKVSK